MIKKSILEKILPQLAPIAESLDISKEQLDEAVFWASRVPGHVCVSAGAYTLKFNSEGTFLFEKKVK